MIIQNPVCWCWWICWSGTPTNCLVLAELAEFSQGDPEIDSNPRIWSEGQVLQIIFQELKDGKIHVEQTNIDHNYWYFRSWRNLKSENVSELFGDELNILSSYLDLREILPKKNLKQNLRILGQLLKSGKFNFCSWISFIIGRRNQLRIHNWYW